MASGLGESPITGPQSSSFTGSSSNNNEVGSFECNICFELAQDPVVTLCGHLFCWPCLYKWLHLHAQSQECPVCKAIIEEQKLVPLYGRGKTPTDPRSKSVPGVDIPQRPTGQRPTTAPSADPNHLPQTNPWLMGGTTPVASTRFGNYTFSAAIGGLIPMLSFQVHGFPDAAAYGPGMGFHYGYNPFLGGHAHGFPQRVGQGRQANFYLKALLLLVGALVVATLVWF